MGEYDGRKYKRIWYPERGRIADACVLLMSTLRGILENNRRHFFVGRDRELSEAAHLLESGSDTRLLFIAAPGGFGKSTLLAEIEARTREKGCAVARIDSRHYQVAPLDIAKVINEKLADANGGGEPVLLMIDTFDHLKTIETWFYSIFLPTLPATVRIMIAGRFRPETRWRTDPAWIGLMRVMELPRFDERETRSYLSRRSLDETVWRLAWRISQGSPLILALVADVCERLGPEALHARAGQDQLQALMLGLAHEAQAPSRQRALQAASIVRTLSKPLLAAMLPDDDADALYTWLTGLSFISSAERGLFPHDLMREAVCADLLRSDPEGHEQLIRRAEAFFAERLVPEAMIPVEETIAELTFLSRYGKSPAQLVGLLEEDPLYGDVPLPADVETASSLVREYEGEEQQKLFDYWYERQPQGLIAIRGTSGELAGFALFVDFGALTEEETRCDSVMDACRRFVRERGLASGHQASVARFWLDRNCHLALSSVQTFALMLVVGRAAAHEEITYCGAIQRDDEISRAIAALAGHDIIPGAELSFEDGSVLTTLHDWSNEPVPSWLVRANRRIRGISGAADPPVPERKELKSALRHALRNFTRSDRLTMNPLLKTRLSMTPRGDGKANIETLRANMIDASKTFLVSPKTACYHDILHHSYFCPMASQLDAAHALNMAPSTFYRHLATAIELLTDILYQRLLEG